MTALFSWNFKVAVHLQKAKSNSFSYFNTLRSGTAFVEKKMSGLMFKSVNHLKIQLNAKLLNWAGDPLLFQSMKKYFQRHFISKFKRLIIYRFNSCTFLSFTMKILVVTNERRDTLNARVENSCVNKKHKESNRWCCSFFYFVDEGWMCIKDPFR